MEGNLGIGLVITAAILMVGVYTFFQIADVIPHEETIVNETIKSTLGTPDGTYQLTKTESVSDTAADLTCYNMTAAGTSPNAPITGGANINVSKSGLVYVSNDGTNFTGRIDCTYLYKPLGNGNAQTTYDAVNTSTSAGFELAAVVIIVIAAVSVLGGLFLLGRT